MRVFMSYNMKMRLHFQAMQVRINGIQLENIAICDMFTKFIIITEKCIFLHHSKKIIMPMFLWTLSAYVFHYKDTRTNKVSPKAAFNKSK